MVLERKAKQWSVKVKNAQTGKVKEIIVDSYWSPAYDGIKECIANVAAVKAWFESGKTGHRIAYVSDSTQVELVEAEVAA